MKTLDLTTGPPGNSPGHILLSAKLCEELRALLNEKTAFREEVGGGTWRLEVIWSRRKKGRAFLGGEQHLKRQGSRRGGKALVGK